MLVAETLAKKKSLAIELHHISVRKIREMILFSTCFLPPSGCGWKYRIIRPGSN
jgi:hypothetical protein